MDELSNVISNMISKRVDAVAITQDPLFVANAGRIAEITADNRLPAIGFADFAHAGGLIG